MAEQPLSQFHVYGTLADPVHAVNLAERIEHIRNTHSRPFIVAIDACLGRLSSVGHITVAKGPVQPGTAVQKNLPKIGDIHLTGIVNIGGMMDYFVLQNTRLHVVMSMAETIAAAFIEVEQALASKRNTTPLWNRLSQQSSLF